MGVSFAKKILGNAEVATFGSLKEACGCPSGQRLGFELEEVQKMRSSPLDRPHGDLGFASFAKSTPSRLGPPIALKLGVALLIAIGREQALTEPAGDGHANGIPDEFPPPSTATAVAFRLLGGRPVCGEALKSFCIAKLWSHKLGRTRDPYSRGRGNPQSGPPLESWHSIDGPAEAAESLRPVEAATQLLLVRRGEVGLLVLIEQNRPRIL